MIFHCLAILHFVHPFPSLDGPLGCFPLLIRGYQCADPVSLVSWRRAGGTSPQRCQGWTNDAVKALGHEWSKERAVFANEVPGTLGRSH